MANEHDLVAEQNRSLMMPARVAIDTAWGWRQARAGLVVVWFKGWTEGWDAERLARRFAQTPPTLESLGAMLTEFHGNFGLAASGPGWVIAASDAARTIPLAATKIDGVWTISDRPGMLAKEAEFGPDDVDPDAAIALAMAGYTIGSSTLYPALALTGPGEIFQITSDRELRRHTYSFYQPWRVREMNAGRAAAEASEAMLEVLDRCFASIGDRVIAIALSAGYDSRVLASAARHLGYRNVRTFTYGQPGSFEATTARALAEKLGYPWRFVALDRARQRDFFTSDAFRDYLDFADSCAASPFVQDMAPLQTLRAVGYLPADAVILNGLSGDFVSGAHIQPKMQDASWMMKPSEDRWASILEMLYEKHFALWEALRTEEHRASIIRQLETAIRSAGGAPSDPELDHGFYECSEFQDRQCKYVTGCQRIYDFLGLDWRLPFWERKMQKFWEGVPNDLKWGQRLYRETLAKENWAGVWLDIPVNRLTIRPHWLRPIRTVAKLAHAPFGRKSWHRFEKRYLQYWMHVSGNGMMVSYWRFFRDQRGSRNGVSWMTERYLLSHGLSWDGSPID